MPGIPTKRGPVKEPLSTPQGQIPDDMTGVIDTSRATWPAIGRVLKQLESVGSTTRVMIPCIGDSRSSGDGLVDPYAQRWTKYLEREVSQRFLPGGHAGWTEFDQCANQSTNNAIGGSFIHSLTAATGTAKAWEPDFGMRLVGAQSFYKYFPNGFHTLGFAHGRTTSTALDINYHAGNVLASKPTSGGTSLFTRPDVQAQWLSSGIANSWNGNKLYADANNFIFGDYENNQVLVGNGLNLYDVTVRITTSASYGVGLNYLFAQGGGHSKDNYISVFNHSEWGRTADVYYSGSAAPSTQKYYPVKGNVATLGQRRVFENILRHLDKYQAKTFRTAANGSDGSTFGGTTGTGAGSAPTGWIGTFGASNLIVIDALYVNSYPDIATLIAGKREVRDALVAEEGVFYLALILPPTSSGSSDSNLSSYVSGMKSMCGENDRSAVICLPDLIGYDKTEAAKKYRLTGSNGQLLHEGEESNNFVARVIAQVLEYSKTVA